MKTYAKIKTVYRRVPQPQCKGLCFEACGPIMLTKTEADKMLAARGAEAPLTGRACCPHLGADNRCSVYDQRPIICRIYGAAEDLRCEHGCAPTISGKAARDLLAEVSAHDERLTVLTWEGRLI